MVQTDLIILSNTSVLNPYCYNDDMIHAAPQVGTSASSIFPFLQYPQPVRENSSSSVLLNLSVVKKKIIF